MKRLDELTAQLADDELDSAGEAELRVLLGADPIAHERHVAWLAVEAGLRGGRRVEMRVSVLERLERDIGKRVVANVMREIRSAGPTIRPRVPRRAWASWPVAVAACLALIGWAALRARRTADEAGRPGPFAGLASVVSVRGGVALVRGGVRSPLGVAADLLPGDTLEVTAEGDAQLALGGQTALALEPGARVTLAGTALVRLHVGTVRAQVAAEPPGRALVFATPHARATVLGTRLALTALPHETVLAVGEGRVLFERADGTVTTVTAGQEARASEAVASALQGASDARPAAPVVVLAMNFEEAALPALVTVGVLTDTAPRRPGSRQAVIGGINFYNPRIGTVALEREPELFRYSDTQVITFDYWLGSDARRIEVQTWNPDRKQNYKLILRDVVHEGWARAEVRLRDLRPVLRKSVAMEGGDRIQEVMIMAGRMGGRPFFVDNLRVTEPAGAALPTSSTAAAATTAGEGDSEDLVKSQAVPAR